jgi:twitching motility protein PilT
VRLLVLHPRALPLPWQRLHAARRRRRGVPRDPPQDPQGFDELGLPPVVTEIAALPRGLVLVTGPTGSGKSTTLASIIDKINRETRQHIITIEDPIEFEHQTSSAWSTSARSAPTRKGFKDALKYALRQDPDVVLVGEMRDLETIEAGPHHRRDGPPGLRHAPHQLARSRRSTASSTSSPPTSSSRSARSSRSCSQAVMTQLLMPRADGPGPRARL